MDNFFFVVSASPKSGTTLLMDMLKQHPLCEGNDYKENYILAKMLDGIGWIINDPHLADFWLKEYDNGLEKINQFINEMANKQSNLAGVKFTSFTSFEFLRYLRNDCPIIFIRRNIFDTYASFKQLEKIEKSSSPMSPEQWFNKYYPKTFKNLDKIESKFLLDYEDLIVNPSDMIEQICKYMKIDSFNLNTKILENTFNYRSFPKEGNEGFVNENGISLNRVNRYIKDLDNNEINVLSKLEQILYQYKSYTEKSYENRTNTWI